MPAVVELLAPAPPVPFVPFVLGSLVLEVVLEEDELVVLVDLSLLLLLSLSVLPQASASTPR